MSQRLNALFVRRVTVPGKYHDEHGLILRVKPTGSKQWVQRLVVKGRRRDIGLGGYPLVSMAEARDAAFANRKLARAGGDPLALRRQPDIPTFEDAAEAVIALHAENWKNSGRTAAIWESSLRRYASPRLGHRLVSDITVADVMAVLVADDFWNHKRETAKKIRRRISTIMRWACSAGLPGRQSRGRSARGRVAEEYQARQSPSCPTARRGRGRPQDSARFWCRDRHQTRDRVSDLDGGPIERGPAWHLERGRF